MKQAIWNDTILASSDDTVVVENNHYFPPASLAHEHFRELHTPIDNAASRRFSHPLPDLGLFMHDSGTGTRSARSLRRQVAFLESHQRSRLLVELLLEELGHRSRVGTQQLVPHFDL